MNKLFRKVIAVALSSALLVTAFAGCGSGGTSSTSSGTSSGTSQSSDAGTDSSAAEGDTAAAAGDASQLSKNGVSEFKYEAGEFLKYDEPLTITFGNNKRIDRRKYLGFRI